MATHKSKKYKAMARARQLAVGRRRTSRAIRDWRTNSGEPMTQQELAAKLGKCLATVNRWEAAQVVPDVLDVQKMEKLKRGLVRRLFQ